MSTKSQRGNNWNKIRQHILNRDNHTCAYCGKEANEVDHIIAIANGGTNDETNLIAACKQCNGRKSDKPLIRNNWYNKKYLKHL